jgi:very-short-patch-repair endonuclease
MDELIKDKRQEQALKALENLRMRLLDLTARNRLINFRHTKSASLRIIDEMPDQLVDTLLADKEMRFAAVSEPTENELIKAGYIDVDDTTGQLQLLKKDPTAEEWAKQLGLSTSYEVPEPTEGNTEDKHFDNAIQTLLFPFEMESRLKKLLQTSESAIQEMGANILYLACGFLEWFDNNDSDNSRYAPLFLVPVRLKKGRLNPKTRTYEYTLGYTGEDIIPNLSLREKLRIDFNMAMPDLDDETQPEVYFEQIKELIRLNQPKWRLRRYISLSLLNFSKLLMYLDLDPERWPEGASIVDHLVINRFLAGYSEVESTEAGDEAAVSFGEEYLIDELKNVHSLYPLIDDADSSQHSALVDAIDGRHLVIEGPPGTGKSQTITNLIAAAMAQGKRVLFVAEKLAALEVVKIRLDRAGLGDFCLELHSHKSQKRKVLDEIQIRLSKHGKYRQPLNIDVEIVRYEELKNALTDHVRRINRLWKGTDHTLHKIFMAATRYREALGINPETLHLKGLRGDNFNTITRRRTEDQVKVFSEVYKAVTEQLDDNATLNQHPWYGVGNTDLQIFDQDRIRSGLESWQSSLADFLQTREQLADELGCNLSDVPDNLTGLTALFNDLKAIPALEGDEILTSLPRLDEETLSNTHRDLKLFLNIQEHYASLRDKVGDDVLRDLTLIDGYLTGSKQLRGMVGSNVELGQLAEAINRLTAIQIQVVEISEPLEQINKAIGDDAASHLSVTERGLHELAVFLEITASLEAQLWRHRDDIFDNDELDQLLPRLRKELEPAVALHYELKPVFNLSVLPGGEELSQLKCTLDEGGVFRWFKSNWRSSRKSLLGFVASGGSSNVVTLRGLLPKAIEYSQRVAEISNNRDYQHSLGEHFTGLDTDLGVIEALRNWYRRIRKEYGVGFGSRVALGTALFHLPTELARGMRSLSGQGLQQQLSDILSDLSSLKEVFTPVAELQTDNAQLIGDEGVVTHLLASLDESIKACGPVAANDAISVEELADRIESLAILKQSVTQWQESDLNNRLFHGSLELKTGIDTDNNAGLASLRHTLSIADCLEKHVSSPVVLHAIKANPSPGTFSILANYRDNLAENIKAYESAYDDFTSTVRLNAELWFNEAGDQITSMLERNIRALENSAYLHNWLAYIHAIEALEDEGLEGIAQAVETGIISPDRAVDAWHAGVYDILAREILREEPELGRFSGSNQEALRGQFREYDERLKALQREKIAWQIDQIQIPPGNKSGKVSERTDLALLEHESGKKKRHIAIRELLRRASGALSAVKPCFMMGPMSVAQYLIPGKITFDLVVMDEASQIKPQDALGAIARGTQLVVVGDPKQLPPTSFFDRALDDEDSDPTAIEESESILDATLPMFKARRLRWHYRSQHESLIAFSNHSFYDSDLVLFPSPHSASDDYGIHYRRLPHGCFVNRRNIEEARVITEAAREHFIHRPEETLGIVAMSADQRTQIERAIETLAKDDEQFQAALEEDGQRAEKLFVKNLENVQGDERDVIYISMTYGPQEPGGKVPNRFGPINSDVGWRRLNVLFTRSRKRMHIFSSMDSSDIVINPTSKRGVQALRGFFEYCETGILNTTKHHTGRVPDSDFEIAVIDALQRHGFKCVPQVGVAGFFIDIAVVDPGNPGKYLMGIECDGATYHSAKSARDRDRLRQEILERLGWKIRRIWSTDWFKHPHAELQPIIRELNALKTERIVEKDLELESEDDAVEMIVQRNEEQESLIEPFVTEEVELREKLLHFDKQVIRIQEPDTPEAGRILRPAMLESLLEHQPTSNWEFFEIIPSYLRKATAASEGKYLEQIFGIINGSSVEPVQEDMF